MPMDASIVKSRPRGVGIDTYPTHTNIILPRFEGRRLARIMAVPLLMGVTVVAMIVAGTFIPLENGGWEEVAVLTAWMLLMSCFAVLIAWMLVRFGLANRKVTVHVDLEVLSVACEGTLGRREYHFLRRDITSVCADTSALSIFVRRARNTSCGSARRANAIGSRRRYQCYLRFPYKYPSETWRPKFEPSFSPTARSFARQALSPTSSSIRVK